MTTQRIFRGDDAERQFAFCQVVRRGDQIFASGMTGRGEDGQIVHPTDAYQQALQALNNLEGYLKEAGSNMADVVRTRIYLVRQQDIADVSRAHREIFEDYPPAATLLFVAGLFSPDILVEIEADVVIDAQ